MIARLKEIALITFLSLVPTLLVWLPFWARIDKFWGVPLAEGGMATIVSNYDGPLYIVVAKTLYNAEAIKAFFQFPLPVEYYAAHFPLFPLLIRLLSNILGSPYAMLAVTAGASVLALFFFYKLARTHLNENDSLFLTALFAVFPARWLIVRSVGSPEPLFVAGIIAAIYYFNQKKYLLAGIFGSLAQLTKSPGIILFAAFFATIFYDSARGLVATKNVGTKVTFAFKKYLPLLLIPISIFAVFAFYAIVTGNFWAYFASGDNIHLSFPPFSIFNYSASWVGTFWLEEVIFVYLIGVVAIQRLAYDKTDPIFWFCLLFFISTLFVSHRDIVRYSLPLVPFFLLAFSEEILKKEFRYVIILLIIPIYLFTLGFISQNTMPVSDWKPLL